MQYLGQDDNDAWPGEDIQDPEAGPDPGYDTVWPEEELIYISPTTGALLTTGAIALSVAEAAAFIILFRRLRPTSWAWYALAGFIGLRFAGTVMSLTAGQTTDVAVLS